MSEGQVSVRDMVVRALALELKRAEEVVLAAGSLRTELGMDSIGAINVAFALEEQLGIEIDVIRGEKFDSVGEIVLIVERIVGEGRP